MVSGHKQQYVDVFFPAYPGDTDLKDTEKLYRISLEEAMHFGPFHDYFEIFYAPDNEIIAIPCNKGTLAEFRLLMLLATDNISEEMIGISTLSGIIRIASYLGIMDGDLCNTLYKNIAQKCFVTDTMNAFFKRVMERSNESNEVTAEEYQVYRDLSNLDPETYMNIFRGYVEAHGLVIEKNSGRRQIFIGSRDEVDFLRNPYETNYPIGEGIEYSLVFTSLTNPIIDKEENIPLLNWFMDCLNIVSFTHTTVFLDTIFHLQNYPLKHLSIGLVYVSGHTLEQFLEPGTALHNNLIHLDIYGYSVKQTLIDILRDMQLTFLAINLRNLPNKSLTHLLGGRINKTIEVLRVADCVLNKESIAAILDLPHITELCLRFKKGIYNTSPPIVFTTTAPATHTIQTLRLDNCDLSNFEIAHIVDLPVLKSLKCSEITFSHHKFEALVDPRSKVYTGLRTLALPKWRYVSINMIAGMRLVSLKVSSSQDFYKILVGKSVLKESLRNLVLNITDTDFVAEDFAPVFELRLTHLSIHITGVPFIETDWLGSLEHSILAMTLVRLELCGYRPSGENLEMFERLRTRGVNVLCCV